MNMQIRCDEDKWSLPFDKGEGRINIFHYPKRKQLDRVIFENYKKGIERWS